MKIYSLLSTVDTDESNHTETTLFLTKEAVQAEMSSLYQNRLEDLKFDMGRQEDGHLCTCGETAAQIADGMDLYAWRIQEQELNVQVVVEVEGGLVQNIYASADVYAIVYDLDPDEETVPSTCEKELNEIISSPGWLRVW